jgi:hypothetical protein
MGRDQDQFEWVNAWADSAKAQPAAFEPVARAVAKAPAVIVPTVVIAPIASSIPDDQLMRDIAEIEKARDALAAMPVGSFSVKRRTQALTLVPARRSDPAPVIIGGVLALVMLTVFGAAAAMTKLAR